MKGYPLVCLTVAALLVGCSPISRIAPSFGPSAHIKLVMMTDNDPAVFISDIRSPGGKPLDIPGDAFYLRPGDYLAHVTCRRPFTANDETQIVQIATANGPDDNYSFNVEANKQYEFDCDFTDKGPQFVLRDVTVVWLATLAASPLSKNGL